MHFFISCAGANYAKHSSAELNSQVMKQMREFIARPPSSQDQDKFYQESVVRSNLTTPYLHIFFNVLFLFLSNINSFHCLLFVSVFIFILPYFILHFFILHLILLSPSSTCTLFKQIPTIVIIISSLSHTLSLSPSLSHTLYPAHAPYSSRPCSFRHGRDQSRSRGKKIKSISEKTDNTTCDSTLVLTQELFLNT